MCYQNRCGEQIGGQTSQESYTTMLFVLSAQSFIKLIFGFLFLLFILLFWLLFLFNRLTDKNDLREKTKIQFNGVLGNKQKKSFHISI